MADAGRARRTPAGRTKEEEGYEPAFNDHHHQQQQQQEVPYFDAHGRSSAGKFKNEKERLMFVCMLI